MSPSVLFVPLSVPLSVPVVFTGGRTLARGLEFGSYAMAMGRRWNVEKGELLNTPSFEWLDAHETRSTVFHISLQSIERGGARGGGEGGGAGGGGGVVGAPLQETRDGLRSPCGRFEMPLH